MVTVILFVVVLGFGTFFVGGGVIFTVSRQVPAFRPFTLVPDRTEHTVFVDVVATIFERATTVTPSVFNCANTVAVFFTPTVATFGAAAVGVPAAGVPAAGVPAAGVPAAGVPPAEGAVT